MDWTDRLTLLVDAVTKGAAKDLKGLQGDLAKTDAAATKSTGVTGKLTDAWGFLKSSGVAAGVGLATVGKWSGIPWPSSPRSAKRPPTWPTRSGSPPSRRRAGSP